jgi:hypothetical protein
LTEGRWKDSPCGPSQRSAEAGGSPILEMQGRVGAAPTTMGRAGTARRPGARQARREGVRVQEPVVEPSLGQNRLQPGGYGPARSARSGLIGSGRLRRHFHGGWDGGHEEGLRRTHGDAAGEKLGASPVDRSAVNVGTVSGPPSPPASQAGGGQALRQLWARGPGGALVVVRGRESRLHGEGGQSSRRRGTGRPGGRR